MCLINGHKGRGEEGEAAAQVQRKRWLCPGISLGDGAGEGWRRVLLLGLFSGLLDKIQAVCFGAQVTSSFSRASDEVLTGLWPSTGAASPTPHPPAQWEPPSLPVLTFHLVGTQKLV